MKLIKRSLVLVSILGLIIGAGIWGWFLGMRDGISLAYSETAGTLATYHLAKENGDDDVAHRAVSDFTQSVACHLLDGRHSFPLRSTFPYRSEVLLSELRAVWTPSDKITFSPTPHYPHTRPNRNYRKEFEAIKPAVDVQYMRRYVY